LAACAEQKKHEGSQVHVFELQNSGQPLFKIFFEVFWCRGRIMGSANSDLSISEPPTEKGFVLGNKRMQLTQRVLAKRKLIGFNEFENFQLIG